MLHPSVRSLPGMRLVLLLALFLAAPASAAAAGLSAGATHACAAKTDGTVWCWGANDFGELGQPGDDESPTPVQVPGLTGATAVATGAAHSCALLTDRTVKCWGQNVDGQLGDGTGNDNSPPQPTPTAVTGLTGVLEISAGAFHTCALKDGGAVVCWGFNVFGQVGNGSTTNATAPVTVSGLTGATRISAGGGHTCATVGDGVRCWGNNGNGQLGATTPTTRQTTPVSVTGLSGIDTISAGSGHTCAVTTGKAAVCWGTNGNGQLGDGTKTSRSTPAAVPGLTDVRSISAGGTHTCAALADGSARCWGAGTSGELGNGTTADSLTPTAVTGLTAAVAVSAGASFTCALQSTGTASCWGDGYSGQTGNGSWSGSSASKTPTTVPGLATVITASTGVRTACAVAAGTLKCWGWGGDGNLGTGVAGQAEPSPITVTIPGLPGGATITDVGVGFGHTCVLTSAKTVYCWGLGQSGQLGNGSTADSSGPVQVSGVGGAGLLTDAEQLSVGTFSNCVLRTGGALACWGANDSGQLGDGVPPDPDDGNADASTPTAVDTSNFTGPAAGVTISNSHACAFTSGGAVLCWGEGGDGQLGAGNDDSSTPEIVAGVSGATQLGAGFASSCALVSGGAVKCWGDDSLGQLGNDPADSTGSTPVTVSLPSGATQLAVGGYHACAVLSAGPGQVSCWGNNSLGQLGNNTLTDSPTPVGVSGLTGAVSIDLGFGSSCARTGGGALTCWGDAYYGQAGDGAAGGHFGLTGLATPVSGLSSVVQPPVDVPKGPPSQPDPPKADPPKSDPPKNDPPVIVKPVPTLRLAGGKVYLAAYLVSPTKKACPRRLTVTISVGKTKQTASVKTKKVTVSKKLRCSLTATIKLKPSKLKKAKSVRVKVSGKGVKTLSKTVKAS